VSGTSAQWYEADLTAHVQARKAAGATLIAIALKNLANTPPYSSFGSRESGTPPELVILPPTPGGATGIVADAYVRDGQYANTNYGTAVELVAKFSADSQYRREAYLKLDISGVQSGDTVRLRLSGRLSDTRAASVTTHIYAVADTSWVETSLTWNNSRTLSGETVLGSVAVSGTSAQWYEADLTGHVQARKAAGATLIAIALKNLADTPPYSSFGSRESGTAPQLVISD
jgi:endoglucanase